VVWALMSRTSPTRNRRRASQHQADLVDDARIGNHRGHSLGCFEVERQRLLAEDREASGNGFFDLPRMLAGPRAHVHGVAGVQHLILRLHHRVAGSIREGLCPLQIRVVHTGPVDERATAPQTLGVVGGDETRSEETDAQLVAHRGDRIRSLACISRTCGRLHSRHLAEGTSMYSRIVVGTNGSDRSLIAVDHAARLAAVCAAELHVVTATSPTDALGTAVKIGHDATKRHRVRVVEHLQAGEPATVLIEVADEIDADLIVVGNNSVAGRIARPDGSVPNRVTHDSGRAVLIVHTG
jgi:nucleotide-binding universal stress UspA family protein